MSLSPQPTSELQTPAAPRAAMSLAAGSGPFDRGIALTPRAAGRYAAHIAPEWNVLRGPNGGYLAALLLRAMTLRLDDAARRPRVLSLHYPKVPAHGPAEVRTQVTREGRSLSWLSAELYQDGQLCVAARAAFSAPWKGVEYDQLQAPSLVPIEQAVPLPQGEGMPPFTNHFEYHSSFGIPFQPNGSGAVGGHIRLREQRPYDAELLAAISDAWFPATLAHDPRMVMGATLDLTVHFRDHDALEQLEAGAHLQTVFRSRYSAEGFFEEDGELWSPDGRLLAQSRQLALAALYG